MNTGQGIPTTNIITMESSSIIAPSNDTTSPPTPPTAATLFLPLLTSLATFLFLLLSISAAVFLAWLAPVIGIWILGRRKSDHDDPSARIVSSVGIFLLLAFLGIVAQFAEQPESLFEGVMNHWKTLYGGTLAACEILAGVGGLQLFGLFNRRRDSADESFEEDTREEEEDARHPPSAKLLIPTTRFLAAATVGLCFTPWSPFLAANLLATRIFAFLLLRVMLFFTTSLAVCGLVAGTVWLGIRICLGSCEKQSQVNHAGGKKMYDEGQGRVMISVFFGGFLGGGTQVVFWFASGVGDAETLFEWRVVQLWVVVLVLEAVGLVVTGVVKGLCWVLGRARGERGEETEAIPLAERRESREGIATLTK